MRAESEVADGLSEVARDYPALSLGSYPFRQADGFGTNLVVRGLNAAQVAAAVAALRTRLGLDG